MNRLADKSRRGEGVPRRWKKGADTVVDMKQEGAEPVKEEGKIELEAYRGWSRACQRVFGPRSW